MNEIVLLAVFLAGVAVGWLTKIPGFRRYYDQVAENRKAIEVAAVQIGRRLAEVEAKRTRAEAIALTLVESFEAYRKERAV